jgi:plasmid replication initiation protein
MSSRQLTVTKANSLVEATYHLTLAEQRLLLLVISRLDSRVELDSRIPHTITAAEVMTVFQVGESRAYQILEEAAERLYTRSVTIHEPDPRQPKSDRLVTRWVAAVNYKPGTGAIELFFAQPIMPFISQLKARFCQYHLANIVPMSSVYAVRLYELLIQWRNAGTRRVELDWLRERFLLGQKYASIRDFKRYVLQIAVDQINTHSDLWVKWEQHKRGRVVHALTFTFGPKAEQKPETESRPASPAKSKPAKPKLTRAYVERHAQPGESWEEAWERCRRQLEQETAG